MMCKEGFNRAFVHANKSAVVTPLLEEVIKRAERKWKIDEAIQCIKSRWHEHPIFAAEEILQAREDSQP